LLIETSLAGNFQLPFHAGWDCVIFRFFNRAGWQKTVKHDCWLGFLFSEILAGQKCRAGIFFPGKLNINIG